MKRIVCILTAIAAVLSLIVCATGCTKKDPALSDLASSQILAMVREGDEPPARISVIETDDYGRVLFTASNTGVFYNDRFVTAYIICQYKDGGRGYCYPDVCYELTNGEKLSNERIEALKERNDWNREIDRGKCSVGPLYLPQENDWMDDLFYSNVNVEKAYTKTAFLGRDSNEKKLYAVVWIKNRGSKDNEYGLYLVVTDRLFQLSAIKKLEDPFDIASCIANIKKETNWR